LSGLERAYRGVVLAVVTGDITELGVDAIVNPANSRLIMGGGVAGAIKRAGGREIEDEAVRHAPVPVGRAVATGAGQLRARHVIHAPTMERPAMHIGRENVELAVKAALECARELRLESLAFPGMGTGVGGLAPEEAAEVMMREAKGHIDRGTCLKRVVFVGFGEDLTRAFSAALKRVFP